MTRSTTTALAIALSASFLVLPACSSEVDVSGLPETTGYEGWPSIEVTGRTPGHGDSYRIIHYNDVAESYAGAGQYPVGTVMVKEIRANDDGNPGDLSYIGIMRKIGPNADNPPGGFNEGGWVFTIASDGEDTSELWFPSCWGHCHVQGPIDGAWFNYGK